MLFADVIDDGAPERAPIASDSAVHDAAGVFSSGKVEKRADCLINRSRINVVEAGAGFGFPVTLDTELGPILSDRTNQRGFIAEVLEQVPHRFGLNFIQLIAVAVALENTRHSGHDPSPNQCEVGGMLGSGGAVSRRRPGHRTDSHSLLSARYASSAGKNTSQARQLPAVGGTFDPVARVERPVTFRSRVAPGQPKTRPGSHPSRSHHAANTMSHGSRAQAAVTEAMPPRGHRLEPLNPWKRVIASESDLRMDKAFQSLGAESPQRKTARATALWAALDALPETDPDRFNKARDAYLADPPDEVESAE